MNRSVIGFLIRYFQESPVGVHRSGISLTKTPRESPNLSFVISWLVDIQLSKVLLSMLWHISSYTLSLMFIGNSPLFKVSKIFIAFKVVVDGKYGTSNGARSINHDEIPKHIRQIICWNYCNDRCRQPHALFCCCGGLYIKSLLMRG
jgi:hypothetical protein